MNWPVGLLLISLPWLAWAAPGSWVGEAAPMRLAVSERHYHSNPLRPVDHRGEGHARITSVWYRYSAPFTESVAIELCREQRCVPLSGPRGRSEAFAGSSLAEPFYFRAWLTLPVRQSVELTGLQLIVNYR